MAQRAHVSSIDAIDRFRIALLKFSHTVRSSLDDADAEIARTIDWLTYDAPAGWRRRAEQHRDEVSSARQALFRKELTSLSEQAATTDERRVLARARQRLRDAEEKVDESRRWAARLTRDREVYAAGVSRLESAIHTDVPRAAGVLAQHVQSLRTYVATTLPTDATATPARRQRGPELPRDLSAQAPATLHELINGIRKRCMDAASANSEGLLETGETAEGRRAVSRGDLAAKCGMPPAETGASVAVLAELGVLGSDRMAAVRTNAGVDGPELWCIVHVESDEQRSRYVIINAEAAVQQRPDLADIFGLPNGCLAILEREEPTLVADPDDTVHILRKEGEQ